jgi:hypothetical protein
MTRLNLVLLLAVLASALYLVHVQYESRRLFTDLDRAKWPKAPPGAGERAPAGREARPGHICGWRSSPREAADALRHTGHHQPTPPIGAGRAGHRRPHTGTWATGVPSEPPGRSQGAASKRGGLLMSSRSIPYTSSPLLASRTPVWRSKFIVAAWSRWPLPAWQRARCTSRSSPTTSTSARARCVLPARWTPGQPRAHLDRNGLILASSIPAPSIWAIPEDVPREPSQAAPAGQTAGDAAGRPQAQAGGRGQDLCLAQAPGGRTGGQGDRRAGHQGHLPAQGIQAPVPGGRGRRPCGGFHQRRRHRAGRRGTHLQQGPGGRAGSRRVIKDRLGRVVEDVGEQIPPVDGRDLQLSIDSKVQFFAYQKLRMRSRRTRPRPAAWWCSTCRPARCWRWPTTPAMCPDKRRNLSGEQLRNRALTDTFEPGSTMKPFTSRWRWRPGACQHPTR